MSIEYRQLNSEKGEIRLLELLPSSDHQSPLRCRLKHSLFHEVKYNALSYVWGQTLDSSTIDVEYEYHDLATEETTNANFQSPVLKNLASALRQLRPEDSSLIIWVDAVCINQTDDDEKSKQVSMMASIYQVAVEVLVWLGPSSNNSDNALRGIDIIGTEAEQFYFEDSMGSIYDKLLDPSTWTDQDPCDDNGSSMKRFLETLLEICDDSSQEGSFSKAFADLTNRKWWSRVWVMQEYLLASEVSFTCGHQKVPGKHFYLGFMAIFGLWSFRAKSTNLLRDKSTTEKERKFLQTYPDTRGWSMMRMKEAEPLAGHLNLASLLTTIHQGDTPTLEIVVTQVVSNVVGVTDPRDRIYGVLGIVETSHGIRPDYKLTCEEVYSKAMTAVLPNLENLSILTYCQPSVNELKLPSWAVDWSSRNAYNGITRNSNRDGHEFHAAGVTKPIVRFLHQTSASTSVLVLGGYIAATIRQIGSSWAELRVKRLEHLEDSVERILDVQQDMLSNNIDPERERIRTIMQLHFSFYATRDWLDELKYFLSDVSNSATSQNGDEIFDILMLGGPPNTSIKVESIRKGFEILVDDSQDGVWLEDLEKRLLVNGVTIAIQANSDNLRIFGSSTGNVGFAPVDAKQGDLIVIFAGCPVPMVLREAGEGFHEIVGPSYVHGLMNGEFEMEEGLLQSFRLR